MRAIKWLLVAALVIVVGGISFFSMFFTDMWWFQHYGFNSTFWVQVAWLWGTRIAAGLLAAAFIWLNLAIARKAVAQAMFRFEDRWPAGLTWSAVRWGQILVSLGLGLIYGSAAGAYWQRIALFFNSQPFGILDPIFHRDVDFYVFQLPYYNLVQSLSMGLLILTLITVGAIYLFTGFFQFDGLKLHLEGPARWHLSLLLAAILGLKAWGYYLGLYELLYSRAGVVFGATYTNMTANRPGLYILTVLALLTGLAILINAFRPGAGRWIVAGLVTMGVASFVVGGVYPNIIQKLIVDPNQLKLEQPYIDNHIAMTRMAYDLDKIEEIDFFPDDQLTSAQLRENEVTIRNIRLWDWSSLLQAYRQLQEFKTYYSFVDVDVDRYTIGGVYSQVMLAAREMDTYGLPSPNWINQHLQYTHGYGVVVSPVNRTTSEGLPEFYLSNIPPVGREELRITRPEIYYGEARSAVPYVIVNTGAREFDYPSGDNDVFTQYAGDGGVPLSNIIRRVAFAARFGTLKILLSNDIGNQSRVMIYRNIKDRVKRVAPFLAYDGDPYIIIHEGRILWILDAYTITDRFPYSRPVRGWNNTLNYVRNSVKVVVDAYSGQMDFYLIDAAEPLARALFAVYQIPYRTLEQMPENVRAHLRYPEDLFEVQSVLFATYHMTDTQVFYNSADAWEVPAANKGRGLMEPYYVIMKLPGEEKEEFVLLRPYTPINKNNMAAWMAARCDGENYGKILVYKFPKEGLTYGPAQIEARIDQDGEISQLFTLWGQMGSDVIRGNLLIIPIARTLLYVEPIFLQAETSQMPELKRVIAVLGGRVAMGLNLSEALQKLIGDWSAAGAADGLSTPGVAGATAAEAQSMSSRQVKELAKEAEERFRAGDLAGAGQALQRLLQAIKELP
ncbi:MAG TPA: UPF0182 family protein [Firmicutes bacterium]|nr:UPF0182 family protein [Bacillota bacterium]